jgi:hypothetical protein
MPAGVVVLVVAETPPGMDAGADCIGPGCAGVAVAA